MGVIALSLGPQWRTRSSVARESSVPQNTTKTMSCMASPPMLVLTVVCSMLDNRVLAHRPTASHLGPNTHAPPTVRHHTGAEAERTARRPALSDGAMPLALRVQDCGQRSTTIDANTTCTNTALRKTIGRISAPSAFDANDAVRTQDSGVQRTYPSRSSTLTGPLDPDRAANAHT